MGVAQALRNWVGRLRPAALVSVPALAAFLDREASLIAQKSVVGYCHVKTKLPISELMKEAAFAQAFEVAKWEAYAAILADLIVVADGYLRASAAGRLEALANGLLALHGQVLGGQPVPPHRGSEGWTQDVARLRLRLASAHAAAPLAIHEVSRVSAARVFETLPIHARLRAPDQPAVEANVQFLIVGLGHVFESRLDAAAIVAELLPRS